MPVALRHYGRDQLSFPGTFHASTPTDAIATTNAITPRMSVASVASSNSVLLLSHALSD
jgi:hypothetical protein